MDIHNEQFEHPLDLNRDMDSARDSGLTQALHQKLLSLEAGSYTLLQYEKGDSISSRKEGLSQDFADKACIVLSGSVTASDRREQHTFPAGYTVAQPVLLAERWDLRAATDNTSLAFVSHEQLREWLYTDDSFRELALQRIHEMFPKERMPEVSREQIRAARDESLLALTTKEAIDFVNRRGGLFEQLNPEALSVYHHDTIGGRDRTIGATEQIWQLVESVSPLMIHLKESEIEAYAAHAMSMANKLRTNTPSGRIEMAMKWFQIELAAVKSQIFEENMPALTEALRDESIVASTDTYHTLVDRVLQVHSLNEMTRQFISDQETSVAPPPYLNGAWDEKLAALFTPEYDGDDSGLPNVLEVLDETLEGIFSVAKKADEPDMVHVRVEKFQLALDIDATQTIELPGDHEVRADIEELEDAIVEGDLSAVGASAYPRQRFPRVTLNQLAYDRKPVNVFDGDYETGLLDTRREYGRHPVDPSLLQRGTAVRLEGVYGSFEKSWCFFRDGSSAFLVAHTGEGRQLSNAAALTLFETRSGHRIETKNIRLARHILTSEERITAAVERMLDRELQERRGTRVLGELIRNPEEIYSQTHSFQHPELLAKLLRSRGGGLESLEIVPVSDPVLQKQFIFYFRLANGEMMRLFQPTIGSRGLYHDTSGAFTGAIMNSDKLTHVSSHTFFNATAGGFAGTDQLAAFKDNDRIGLPTDIAHGDLIMPWSSIGGRSGEHHLTNILRFTDAIRSPEIDAIKSRIYRHFDELPLHHTSSHYCIGAPALETEGLITNVIDRGFASVDCESLPNLRQPGLLTFTPIYVHSDDPRQGISDPTQSLAFGAPLAEGSRAHPALYEAFIDMIELAALLDSDTLRAS